MSFLRQYLTSVGTVLLSPWRCVVREMAFIPARRVAGVATIHIVLAAMMSTLPSIWVFLAGKGFTLGSGEMDLGSDDLPFVTPGQVVFGLAASVVLWSLVLALLVGVSVMVADWLYLQDRRGFHEAVRVSCLTTAWFVVWAGVLSLGTTVSRNGLVWPARWPAGETFEVRDRLIYVLMAYPVIWAAGIRPPVEGGLRMGRIPFAALSVALWWTAWAVLWRALPWTSIEAYTG